MRRLRRAWLKLASDEIADRLEGLEQTGLESQCIVTLGIEIEVPWSAVFSHRAFSITDADYAWLRDQKERPFRLSEQMGVPHGRHGEATFWEFSHRAVRHHETLVREVEALVGLDLLRLGAHTYPLHLTIGGLRVDEHSYLLARCLEATGWGCGGARLIGPSRKGLGWAARGVTGLRQRCKGDLNMELGAEVAVEIRTFELVSLFSLAQLLKSAFYLGQMVRSYHLDGQGWLGQQWLAFADEAKRLFDTNGLKNPSDWWNGAGQLPEVNPFFGLARAIGADGQSKFSEQARQLVGDYRNRVTKTEEAR